MYRRKRRLCEKPIKGMKVEMYSRFISKTDLIFLDFKAKLSFRVILRCIRLNVSNEYEKLKLR